MRAGGCDSRPTRSPAPNMWTNLDVLWFSAILPRRCLDHVFADRVPRTVCTRHSSMRRHAYSSEVLALRALLRDRAESRDEAPAHNRARARTHAANLAT